MRLNLSALLLSTALVTGFGAVALVTPTLVPVAHAQTPGEVDVDGLLKLLPADKVKATYESKSYDAATGVTKIIKLKFEDPRSPNGDAVTMDEVDITGLDYGAFQAVWDFSKYGATRDTSFKQLFGNVTITNFAFVHAGQTIGSFAQLTSGGVQMKQLDNLPPGQNGTPQTDMDGLKFVGSLLDSIIAGPIELDSLAVQENATNKVSLAKITLAGFTRGQIGASKMESFETDMNGYTNKIASADSEGADITKVLPWMMKAQLPPVTPDPLLYVGAGEASDIEYDIQGTKVTISSYKIDPINFYWLVPTQFKLALNDLVITPDLSNTTNPDVQEFKELGVDHLDIDAGLDWAFDGAAGAASLKDLHIYESQLFNVALNFNLTGIDLAKLVDQATAQMAAMQIGLTSAQLIVKNNGGFDKVLALAAKEQGTTPDALKQQALAQLNQIEGGVPAADGTTKPPTDRVKSIIEALKSFINAPGTLTIKAEPASPVSAMMGIGAMMDPMGAADTLGITVEATP